jgi:hypothetical protein
VMPPVRTDNFVPLIALLFGVCLAIFASLQLHDEQRAEFKAEITKLRKEIRDTTATPYWMAECERRLSGLEMEAGMCQ